jgi:integrase
VVHSDCLSPPVKAGLGADDLRLRAELDAASSEDIHQGGDVGQVLIGQRLIGQGRQRRSAALAVGLRQGEAFGLSWEDVDLNTGTITVRYELQRIDGKLQPVEPKTALSRRTIVLPAVAIDALRRHRLRLREERLDDGNFHCDRTQHTGR